MTTSTGSPDSERTGRLSLVTGGTGMIGGAIARLLLGRGSDVRVLVRSQSRAAVLLEQLGAEIVVGDITDSPSVRRAIEGCSDVYHCAALVDPFHWDRDDFDRVNVGGTRNVVDASTAAGVERLLHMSSIAAIGAEPGTRASEATRPRCSWKPGYGRSKYLSEKLALEAAAVMHVVSLNPAVVFGPGDRHLVRLIRAFLQGRLPAITFADRPMPLVYVGDVARAGMTALERGRTGQRYIVAQPTITVREFFGGLSVASGRRAPRVRFPDWVGVAGALGWTPFAFLRRRRPPFNSIAALRKGPADFDGALATSELGFEYTPFAEAIDATVRRLVAED